MTLNNYTDDSSPMSTSDVESFTGKIVCNIDGSSYIIDAENATLSSLNHNSLCVAAISVTNEKSSILQATKSASKSFENSNLTTTKTITTKNFSTTNYDQQQHLNELQQTANPKIHTFRVVSANDASIQLRQENKILKIQKPILMCFICKLSFGITKSFSLHANSEHGLDLQDLEKHLLTQREYSSAIIQKNMDENPQISFLEPVSIETPTLSVTSSFEDCSGMDSKLENDDRLTSLNNKTICGQTQNPQNVNFSASNAAADNIPSSNASSSSSSKTSCSSSSPLSPCCATNSVITTSTPTTIAISSDKPQVFMSPSYDDQQSQCAYDSTPTPTQTHITGLSSTASTTLSSLNLDKSKTNNYNISNPSSDHLTTSDIATTTTTNNTTISVTSSTSTSTPSITLSLPSTSTSTTTTKVATSSLSLNTGVDLSATTGNLSIDASSTDSLVDINKYNNSDNSNSNNDSIEPPHSQHINTVIKSANLSPKSHQNQHQHHHQSTIMNTSIMGDFLQQHLERIAGGSRMVADEETQHKHLDHETMSWSQPTENTFSSPGMASNVSAAQISSLHTSLSALNSDQNNSNSVKLISEFLQHQLVAAQHQKQLTYPFSHVDMSINIGANTSALVNACPEHTDFKGIDCKSCEMLEIHSNIKQSPQITPQPRSPTSSSIAATTGMAMLTTANQLSMSPNNSQNANNMLSGLNSTINTSPLNTPGCAASFTIGACSDHINGRPLGVECARCEMILNSARLNSNVQMSTRNSCKTLKCPQCNWHYKYQETLEIHMREKHPDGESACGYCLAGQQHPRLARGESYSCGYKPYRCEICNYSTTTKGNLSIHMQSDKHLNNMQELNSSQNMVAAAVAVATGGVGKLETTPKITMGNTMNSLAQQQQQHQQHQQHQQQQQQQQQQRTLGNSSNNANINASLTSAVGCGTSSTSLQVANVLQPGNGGISGVVGGLSIKPKPSFRCDICSYETSVARNLRIHMTSEKHTHNMAVLQNNIKHIQAFSFLHLQKQQQQQQQQPEVALADLAYNQALMIQMLHQNSAAATSQTQSQLPGSCQLDNSPVAVVATKEALMLKVTSPTTPTEMPPSPYSPKSNDLNLSELGSTKTIEPPINPDMWPTTLFSCLVCSNFNTNNLDELNQHLIIDRSRQITTSHPPNSSISPTPSNISSPMANSSNSSTGTMYFSDILMVQNNNYICRLCNYKTNLKANFQLHSKTDKHLQKLNFINHLREGGARNEYKLIYYQQHQQQIGANTVQIKCNSCDFYTNSIQKLSLHTQHMRHETMIMIFQHLNYLVQQQQQQQQQASNDVSSININSETAPHSLEDDTQTTTTATASASAVDCTNTAGINKTLHCHLCNFKANSLLEMIQHVKSIRHLQVEQFVCLQRRSEQLETPSLDDVFKLCDKSLQNNDPTAAAATTSTTPTQTNNIMDNKAAACFSSLIETGNEDFSNKMIFEQSEGNDDNNIKSVDHKINLSSISSLTHHSQDSGEKQTTTTAMEDMANVTTNNIPSIIYKCSHCDYFGQLKNEVESHIGSTHPNADSEDVISIPTNPVAIQAFQAAMAAATLAAVSRASTTSYTGSPLASPNTSQTKLSASLQEDDDDMRPVAVKRERLDHGDQETLQKETSTIIHDENTNMEVVEQQQEVVMQTTQEQHDKSVQCPLCQDYFSEKHTLENHLMTIHSVNTDGLARLLLMVDTSGWQSVDVANPAAHTAVNETPTTSSKVFNDMQLGPKQQSLNVYELLQCQQCGSSFKHEQQLLQHAQKMQHYTQQHGEYMCLAFNSARNRCIKHFPTLTAMFNHYNDTHMSLVISERHVYKYRCKQCSLAFKTQEKLTTHTLYHTMRDATKCTMCQRNFRSIQSLQKHMEQVHSQVTTTAGNSSECSSPRTVSPSESEVERPLPQASRSTSISDKVENESTRSVTPGQDLQCPTQSPSSTLNDLQTSTSLSTHQQQQMAALTALIKQQQQQQTPPTSEIMHHLQMQQHHQQLQNIPALHNLQQMQQQLPQLAAAAAASGMPLNPVEMLNLMQFHHLMSLNFMNLAPPLIFGGNSAATAVSSGNSSNTTTSTNIPNNSVSTQQQQQQHNSITSTDSTAPSTSAGSNAPVITALPNVDVNVQIMQQQQISPGASNSQLTNNQKRARTRITDEQLKILRAHFDINNSPSEESILEMSQKANLPMKVVKHWFRNTLFKERQRNKDSPYNFNNPPSTTLNLEEYERTGQTKVMPLVEHMQQQQPQIPSRPSSAHSNSNISEYSNQQHHQQQVEQKQREEAETLRSQASSVASLTFPLDVQIKTEPGEDLTTTTTIQTSASVMSNFLKQHQQQQKVRFSSLEQPDHDMTSLITEQHLSSAALAAATAAAQQHQQQQHVAAVAAATFYNSYETKSESGSSEIHSRPQTPNSNTTSNLYASMNDLLSQQLENMPLNQMGPPKKFQLNPSTNPCVNINSTSDQRSTNLSQTSVNVSSCSSGGITVSSKLFEKNSPSAQYDTNSNSSNSSTTSSGKRANRTRFTDYQIKVLQEFFENNSYPKDSDLEYLSKLLLLSPRVIVVWFQNARQKQRKIYENQPNNSLYESEEKKQNINYACKKCSLVFQRYYELIRHQKNHCFKEENNKKSAKAQIAAAQIAQNLSSEDSNSSMDINSAAAAALLAQHHTVVATTSLVKNTSATSEFSTLPGSATPPPRDQSSNSNNDKQQKFDCDKCKMTFSHFEHLREHQLMHLVNPNLHLTGETTSATASAVAAYGPFGSILQSLQQAAHLQQAAASSANTHTAAKKRKYSETSSNADEVSSLGGISLTGVDYDGHAKKYNFLYQYFLQNEVNSELRQQFHTQDSSELNMEFLANYYQQTELKKRNNYDFLFQYYIRTEQQTNANFELADNNKPNIEFLLQYYQLCESKKFFQLEASPQRIHDGTLAHTAGIITSQHNNASISNRSRLASNDSNNSSSHGGSGIYEESNGGGVLNSSPQAKSYSIIELNTQQNGQHSNNNNNNDSLETEKDNIHFSPKITEDSTSHCASKLEEQMDQLDGLQEVKNPSISKQLQPITITSPLHLQSESTFGAGTYYQNLEDFLDATMIENHNQTLTFPTGSRNKEALRSSQYTPTSPTNTQYTIQPVAAAVSDNAENSNQKQTNKRLRTTILPEQLNFLYECYQNESNPSRKMLEEIAKKVNLKKRVVQVWFQNSRAKDKKSRNQHRKHFSNISDDNSNSSNMTNNTNKANVSSSVLTTPLSTVTTGCELSNDTIRDCNLCQVSQVNIQQHAFTVEHIRKVKELLSQTTKTTGANTLLNNSSSHDDEETLGCTAANKQEQLALMMMALQSQHMTGINSNSFNSLTVGINDTAAKCDSVESAKHNLGVQLTKAKRNPIKKKKTMMKNMTAATKKPQIPLTANEPIADTVANDSEIFLNFNANLASNFTLNHPMTAAIRSVKKQKPFYNRVDILTLGQDENDDGNNNHDEESEAKQLDNVMECAEDVKHNESNSETLENANDVSKLYGYNHISAFERV